MSERRVLLTGASGFIGGRLISRLLHAGWRVRALSRKSLPEAECFSGTLDDIDVLERACRGVDAVVHCAGYAHAFELPGRESRRLHRRINFELAAGFAEIAAAEGVARFVFLSSVKAAGHNGLEAGNECSPLPPEGAYGQAKRLAEEAIMNHGQRTGMETVCLRLGMTYGRGGRGNLERMAAAIRAGWFPPLPETGERRSVLHVEDAVEAIQVALSHPGAPGRTFIVTDPTPYTARQMQDAIRATLDMPSLGKGVPPALLRFAGRIGDIANVLLPRPFPIRTEVVKRLLEGESYSCARIARELGWQARISLQEGVAEMLARQEDLYV